MSGKWEVRSQNVKFKTVFFFLSGAEENTQESRFDSSDCANIGGAAPEKATKERMCLLSETLLLPGSVVNSWCPPGQGRESGALCGSAAIISPTEGQQRMPMLLVVAMPQNKESEH